jgi:membrane associated rhomboid family serine protease
VLSFSNSFFPFGNARATAVRTLLAVTVGVFLLQKLVDMRTGGVFTFIFGLRPDNVLRGDLWQMLTYMFLHGGVLHLLLNMFVLFMFGRDIEWTLGSGRFLLLYLGCGLLGGIGWMLLSGSDHAVCIGASGAVFGVIGTFAALFASRRVTLLLMFVLPVTMTARTLALVLGLITVLSMFADDGNIAHAAHLAGGVAGYLYGLHVVGSGRDTGKRRRTGRSLRMPAWLRRSRAGAWQAPRADSQDTAPPDSREVDRILDKIADHGISSLSREEKDVLDRASQARDRQGGRTA